MNSFMGVLVTALLSASAYFMFACNDRARASLSGLLALKACALWLVASGGLGGAPAVAACFLGGLAVLSLLLPAFTASAGTYGGAKTVLAAFTAALLLIFAFGGCGSKPALMPAVAYELPLKFMPGRLAAAGGGEIYISAEREKNVYQYSVKTGKKIKSIPCGYGPGEILVKNGRVYVANEKGASVTVYDPVSDTAETFDCGGEYPGALALNAEKNLLYVANTGSSNVAVIDLKARAVKNRIITGRWPSDLYLSQDNKVLYVACKYTNTVQMIDAEKEEFLFTRIETGVSPVQLISLDKRYMAIINEWEYAFNQQSAILVFDKKDYDVESSIRVDGGIFNGALSKSRKYLFISEPQKDRVVFVDVRKKQAVHSMEFKDCAPRWLALSKDGRELYISAPGTKKVITVAVNGFL
jgi:YVTN family beta-propeller protein